MNLKTPSNHHFFLRALILAVFFCNWISAENPCGGNCEAPTCGQADSPQHSDLFLPNGECISGKSAEDYMKEVRSKRTECIQKYHDVFKPWQKEAACQTGADFFFDVFNPGAKISKGVQGMEKVKEVTDKWSKRAAKKKKEVTKFIMKKLGRLNAYSRLARQKISKAENAYKKATLQQGKGKELIEVLCESQFDSWSQIDTAKLCKDMADKVGKEVSGKVVEGYKSLLDLMINSTVEVKKGLKDIQEKWDKIKKTNPSDIPILNDYENEFLLVKDVAERFNNVVNDMENYAKNKIVSLCEGEAQSTAIAEACHNMCDPSALQKLKESGDYWCDCEDNEKLCTNHSPQDWTVWYCTHQDNCCMNEEKCGDDCYTPGGALNLVCCDSPWNPEEKFLASDHCGDQ